MARFTAPPLAAATMNADPICGMTVNDRKQQQTIKPEPPETEKDLGKDLKTFGQLPAKSKELLILQDQTEKSTGQEKIDLYKITRDKSK